MLAETRTALADFIKQSGKSQRQISKETGLSTSVISQFLNGSYTGDNKEELTAHLETVTEQIADLMKETDNATRFVELAEQYAVHQPRQQYNQGILLTWPAPCRQPVHDIGEQRHLRLILDNLGGANDNIRSAAMEIINKEIIYK